jgi:DNA-binding MarR family transcriptional regulator
MSVGIERLVRKGYVRRTRGVADQRRVELRLTEAGVRIRSQQSVLEPELVSALLAELSAAERVEALQGLDLLARAAEEMMSHKDTRTTRASARKTSRR